MSKKKPPSLTPPVSNHQPEGVYIPLVYDADGRLNKECFDKIRPYLNVEGFYKGLVHAMLETESLKSAVQQILDKQERNQINEDE